MSSVVKEEEVKTEEKDVDVVKESRIWK
jgi:hypothetical protein